MSDLLDAIAACIKHVSSTHSVNIQKDRHTAKRISAPSVQRVLRKRARSRN